jgi:peptide-methionine (S)-S-oxide reductase
MYEAKHDFLIALAHVGRVGRIYRRGHGCFPSIAHVPIAGKVKSPTVSDLLAILYMKELYMPVKSARAQAIFGGGCFWCLEALFERIPGVLEVENGYAGGSRDHPSYQEVCTGLTGHAEVVRITFDPSEVSYAELLGWFWKVHDPTTENRQGADVGTQYRSIIYYLDETQRREAEESMRTEQARLRDPIVTELLPAPRFWVAEDYHQDYYRAHPEAGYCRVVIAPKLIKAGIM